MECPRCRLTNPPGSVHCDCGYNFETGAVHSDAREKRLGVLETWDIEVLPAIASGLFAGGFLYYLFGQLNNNPQLNAWQWYGAAVFLAAVGLAGVFSRAVPPEAIALGLGIAPTLVFCFEVVYLHPAESMWPIVLPLVFLFSLPAPLLGSSVGRLVRHTRIPRPAYLVPLTGALVIGVLLPHLTDPRSQRLEGEEVPRLLKQIYEAEMIYSAHQSDKRFVCDGTLLPGPVGNLGWLGNSSGARKDLIVNYYNISLDCPDEIRPRRFRVTASSRDGYILAPRVSIDETGRLVIEPATRAPNTPHYAR